MILNIEIYKNNKKINEQQIFDATRIYKELATVLYAKETKRASKTKICCSGVCVKDLTITQIYNSDKTMLQNTTYKYIYKFENIEI